MKEIELRYNELDADTYLQLRGGVHWKALSHEQAALALKNSLYVVAAYEEDTCVGMGRLVGDGVVICYVQDLIVLPYVQQQGIGSKILNELKQYAERLRVPDTEMMICLMCAKGREPFYKKHDFIARPTKELGPGMIQYLNNTTKNTDIML